MQKQIKISIPTPCHEDWAAMTHAEKGRFCASCQKVVHDFTRSSDREIASVLSKDSNICGRFVSTQLERDLVIPKEKSTMWIAASAAIMSFLSLGTAGAYSQTTNGAQTESLPQNITYNGNLKSRRLITGTVLDEDNNPVRAVAVQVRGTSIEAITDAKGKFEIEANPGDVLRLKGYNIKTMKLDVTDKEEYNIVVKSRRIREKDSHILMGSPRYF